MLHRKLRNSVVDKEVFDNSIEKAIFSLFRIDVINLIRNKVSLAKNFHIQPSELESMPMWEYELFMDELNNRIKEENKEQEEEAKKYDVEKYKNMASKPPKLPNMNTSQFKLPKY